MTGGERDAGDATPPPGRGDAAERLLGAGHALSRREVSAGAGVSLLQARRFWHALGFPAMGDDELSFTDADLAALDRVVHLSGAFDDAMMLAMTRAFARTAERLATWQLSLGVEAALGGADDETGAPVVPDLAATLAADEEAEEGLFDQRLGPKTRASVAEFLVASADDLEPLLVYAWRRHLAAAIGSLVAEGMPDDATSTERCVGFADLVDFTSLVSRLSERQLSRLVQQFEAHAADIVTAHGGRIVKTLGDEVVYTCERPAPAAAIGLDLCESLAQDPAMPSLRVGMARGPVLWQLGDVFGTTVNRASRLTRIARPDTVVVDAALAAELGNLSGFETRPLPPRALRGLGVTAFSELRRTPVAARRRPVARRRP